MNRLSAFILCALGLVLSGCTISQNVDQVGTGTAISKIYVEDNEAVHMDALVDVIVAQLKELGFESEKYKGNLPEDAKHYLTFTANWQWDMAMYLTYFKVNLYEDGVILGDVVYDARKGGGNMGKFGKTAEKVQPLLDELLKNVKREGQFSSMGTN